MCKCIRIVVKGKVQGVYYRDSTMAKAQSLGIVGWVRNLSNGDVEAMAMGKEEDLKKIIDWMWEGPTAAKVYEVLVFEEKPIDKFETFKVIYAR
ncbi:MAG: acylphosphatase [Candidatus Methanofastidiosia archaeon]